MLSQTMRIVFMGAPDFAVPTLRDIVRNGHSIVAVYTRAPKPGGRRGLEVKQTPVHRVAETLNIPVHTPSSLRTEGVQRTFEDHAADVGLVIAYGLLLPSAILVAPRLGCLNLHASLLPRWRGAAPIQRAIMAGDPETGVDLMRMEEGLDTGPVAMRETVPICPTDTAGDLTDRLAHVAARLAVRGLRSLEDGSIEFVEQATAGACYARKIDKTETEIDWTRSAIEVRNHVHGLSPAPGAFSTLMIRARPERIRVLRVQALDASGRPGTILDDSMTVACGRGAVRVVEAQRAGRIVMAGAELLRRESVRTGTTFKPREGVSFETGSRV
jgi:methionyl-tRNA formyltransferase